MNEYSMLKTRLNIKLPSIKMVDMKARFDCFKVLFLLIFLSWKSNLMAITAIAPNHQSLQYQGRIEVKNANERNFIWSGTSVKMRFNGTKLWVRFTDHALGADDATNYYNVLVNEELVEVLKLNKKDSIYELKGIPAGKDCLVEIFKRTEAAVGGSTFKGFVLDGRILPMKNTAFRKIEVIGDSWSCGYGNVVKYADPSIHPGFHSANEDNYSAFGSIVSRRFGAQYMCTAYSGRGVSRNFDGSTTGTMPKIYKTLIPDDTNTKWDTKLYTADLLICFLGTNDFAKEREGISLDSATFVASYIELIKALKNDQPKAKILIVYGGSVTDDYPKGKRWLSRWRNYTTAVVKYFGEDSSLMKFELAPQKAPYGEDFHPSEQTQRDIAMQICAVIQKYLGWQ
ncbi:MAG: SGNH/GDSL hydrolase family protein [Bacteroidetes bacterium]|nr:SGNH/GDSL hydrolase family protein [Bacteroidota bacterium]